MPCRTYPGAKVAIFSENTSRKPNILMFSKQYCIFVVKIYISNMKPFNFNYLLLVIALGISSCGVKPSGEEEIKTLSVVQKSFVEKAYSSDVFSSVGYVPLSTSDDVLIGNITKIIHKDTILYITDGNALYKFNEEGRFLGEIRKKGQGPDEYLGIADFETNTHETVWILSRNKLYQYTWNNELKKKIDLNTRASNIHFISPDELYVYAGNERDENNQHQLKRIDLQTNTITNTYLEIDKKKARYLHVHSPIHFSKEAGNEGVYFFNSFDDTIYKLSNDTILSAFHINIIDKNIPASFFDNEYSDISAFFQSLFKGNYAYGTNLFVEYENQYLFSYVYARELHLSLISKETKESVLDFTTLIEDKYLLAYPINLTEQSLFIQPDNELILPLIPSDIMEYAKTNLSPENQNKLTQIIQYKDDDQNPVLLIVKPGYASSNETK
jgi:hypothetical protein